MYNFTRLEVILNGLKFELTGDFEEATSFYIDEALYNSHDVTELWNAFDFSDRYFMQIRNQISEYFSRG